MAFSLSTVEEIIVRVKDIVPELRATTADDRLQRGINDAMRFLINENTSRNWRFHVTVATRDLETGGLVDLPPDFVALDSVWFLNTDDNTYEKATEAERADLLLFDSEERSYNSGESYYAFRGSYIDTRPTVEATVTGGVRINYYYMDEDIEAGESLSVFLERWRELIAYYVARKEDVRTDEERVKLDSHFIMLLAQYRRASRRSLGQPKTMGSARSVMAKKTRRFGRIG